MGTYSILGSTQSSVHGTDLRTMLDQAQPRDVVGHWVAMSGYGLCLGIWDG